MMNKKKKALLFLFIIHHSAFIILLAGCGARRTPDLERIFDASRRREGKRPLIIIPGILGSQLVNQKTGEVVWPSAFRSSEDGLGLPMTPDLAANRDALVASKIVDRAKLARLAPQVYVYYEMLDVLRRFGGYREGSWENPDAQGDRDTYYIFAYDWRRDNVETARELARRVEELKGKLGRPDLRFNIVAHSMGGLIARYAAMYGDRDLPPDGAQATATWDGARFISKIFMFGTPNMGSMEAFATLLEGYSVTEGLRRRVRLLNKLSREDALSVPSIFQLLPHPTEVRFLDENLQTLALDLYDPEVWRRHAWSAAYNAEFRRRYAQGQSPGEPSPAQTRSLADLEGFLAAALERARRFHTALDAPAGASPPVPLYSFAGDCEETLAAPVILRDEKRGTWQTLISPRSFRTTAGRRVSRRELVRAMYEPGDGRVTRRSALGENARVTRRASVLYETGLPIAYAVFACDLHSDLQNNKTLLDNALTLLINELTN